MNFIMIQNTQQFAFIYYLKKTSDPESSGLSLMKLKWQYDYIYIYVMNGFYYCSICDAKCSLISINNQDIIICSRTLYFRD